MKFLRFAFVSVAAGLLGATAHAQDVTVSPFTWLHPDEDPPDTLPAPKREARVHFPDELRNTPDVGYVIVSSNFDEKGKPLGGYHAATLPAYMRVTEAALFEVPCLPGRRAGKPVVTAVRQTVIFNPASASPSAPDATPRLIEVSAIPVQTDGVKEKPFADLSRVVWCDLSVDDSGRVTAVKNASADLAAAIERATRKWKFVPARRAGRPVAAEIHAPCLIYYHGNDPQPDSLPRPITQHPPVYPPAMRASQMRGDVLVEFTIDIEGRVRNPHVVRSLNPAFDEAAIEAARQWKFEPAKLRGVPIKVRSQQPMHFELEGVVNGGRDGFELKHRGDPSSLPPETRFDIAPKPRGSVRAVYPYALLRDGVRGDAAVAFEVLANGRVGRTRVTSATAPEFGRALQAAVEAFEYEPALRGGRPVATVLGFQQRFSQDERYQLVSNEDRDLLRREKKHPETILGMKALDGRLRPVSARPPQFPSALAPSVEQGEALVEFLVDTAGHARLPRVVSASDDAFGYAAVQAVSTWRFEPPKAGGKPAVARARVPVEFKADAPATTRGAEQAPGQK